MKGAIFMNTEENKEFYDKHIAPIRRQLIMDEVITSLSYQDASRIVHSVAAMGASPEATRFNIRLIKTDISDFFYSIPRNEIRYAAQVLARYTGVPVTTIFPLITTQHEGKLIVPPGYSTSPIVADIVVNKIINDSIREYQRTIMTSDVENIWYDGARRSTAISSISPYTYGRGHNILIVHRRHGTRRYVSVIRYVDDILVIDACCTQSRDIFVQPELDHINIHEIVFGSTSWIRLSDTKTGYIQLSNPRDDRTRIDIEKSSPDFEFSFLGTSIKDRRIITLSSGKERKFRQAIIHYMQNINAYLHEIHGTDQPFPLAMLARAVVDDRADMLNELLPITYNGTRDLLQTTAHIAFLTIGGVKLLPEHVLSTRDKQLIAWGLDNNIFITTPITTSIPTTTGNDFADNITQLLAGETGRHYAYGLRHIVGRHILSMPNQPQICKAYAYLMFSPTLAKLIRQRVSNE